MKRAIHSKTLWLNGSIVLLLGLIELAAATFSVYLPPIAYSILIFISGAGNMALRCYTNQQLVK